VYLLRLESASGGEQAGFGVLGYPSGVGVAPDSLTMQVFPHPSNITSSLYIPRKIDRRNFSGKLQGRFFHDNGLDKAVREPRKEKARFQKYLQRSEAARVRFQKDSAALARMQRDIRNQQRQTMQRVLVLTSAIIIQTYWRGFIVRCTQTRKRARKGVMLMIGISMFIAIKSRLKKNVTKIQCLVRRKQAWEKAKRRVRLVRCATLLQAQSRGIRARRRAGIAMAVRTIATEVVETSGLIAASRALQFLILPDISASIIQRTWLAYREAIRQEELRIEQRLKELKEISEESENAKKEKRAHGRGGRAGRLDKSTSRRGMSRGGESRSSLPQVGARTDSQSALSSNLNAVAAVLQSSMSDLAGEKDGEAASTGEGGSSGGGGDTMSEVRDSESVFSAAGSGAGLQPHRPGGNSLRRSSKPSLRAQLGMTEGGGREGS